MGIPRFKAADKVLIKEKCTANKSSNSHLGKVVTVVPSETFWFDFVIDGARGTVFERDYDKVELTNPYRWEPDELKHVHIDRDTASSINQSRKKDSL